MVSKKQPRQKTVSFKVTESHRKLIEILAASMTIKRGRRHSLTDVVEEAVLLLAKREGVKL